MYKNPNNYKMYVELLDTTYETSEPTERVEYHTTRCPSLFNNTYIPSLKQNSHNTNNDIELIIIILPTVCVTILIIYIAFKFYQLKNVLNNPDEGVANFGTTINETIDI